MSDTETWDEAYERLLRETKLGEQIEEMAEYLRVAERSLGSSLGYMFTGPQLAVLVGQLRELRARRMAAGREPDDEVNAAADMCCCGQMEPGDAVPALTYEQQHIRRLFDGCPLHGTGSDHAEAPPDPEAIARRLLGELGPELAAAVCVQLLGRLPRREP